MTIHLTQDPNFRLIYTDTWQKDTEKPRLKFWFLIQAGSFSRNQTCAISVSKKKNPAVDQHYNDRSWVKTYLTECTQDVTSLQAQLQTTRSYNITKAFIWVQEAGYQCFHQMSQARAEVGSSQQPAFKMLKKTWQVSKILKIPQGIVFQQSETAVSSACEKSD